MRMMGRRGRTAWGLAAAALGIGAAAGAVLGAFPAGALRAAFGVAAYVAVTLGVVLWERRQD